MTLRTLMLSLILSLSLLAATANAILIEIEDSREIDAATVTLPGSTAGYLLFKPCGQCASVSMQVNIDTQYFLGGQEVTLNVFRQDAELEGLMNLFYEPESGIVTRIEL